MTVAVLVLLGLCKRHISEFTMVSHIQSQVKSNVSQGISVS